MNRRDVLKSIGLVGLAALAPATVPFSVKKAYAQAADLPTPPRWNGEPLGRLTRGNMDVRTEPTYDAPSVRPLRRDDVIRVRGTETGQAFFPHNDLWLETAGGYVYSSYVQPMHYHLSNTPLADLGEGRWAELTVPYSDAIRFPGSTVPDDFVSRMVYKSAFRVTDLVEGEDGLAWYRVQEMYQHFYMRATHLRIIPEDELTPLHTDVDPAEKWIDIAIIGQTVTAYHGETPIRRWLTSTGRQGKGTPQGTFTVWDKRISERMVSAAGADIDDPDNYNLPGVPFTSYFTGNWVAVHGCTWHNDFGRVRSAGCVNLTPDAARWIWRWCTPQGDLSTLYTRPPAGQDGTRVVVRFS